MGWIASFTGLRRVGAPPVLAAAAVALVFVLTKLTASSSDSEPPTAAG